MWLQPLTKIMELQPQSQIKVPYKKNCIFIKTSTWTPSQLKMILKEHNES